MALKEVEFKYTGGERGWKGDSPRVELDTRKLKDIGWQPETSIEEGVRRTVKYLKENEWLLELRE